MGSYSDGAGAHGYWLTGTVFTTIDFPGASGTILLGINDVGQIVGYTDDAAIGFLYDIQAQTFTTLEYSASTQTLPFAINNAGTIVGLVQDPVSGLAMGFELNGTRYKTVKAPGAPRTVLTSINNLDQALVLGDYVGARNKAGILESGNLRKLPPKGNREPVAINDNGAISGSYVVHQTDHAGFVVQNNTSRQIRFPGSQETFAYGINNAGVVVGFFYDKNTELHGFIWTPPTDAGKEIIGATSRLRSETQLLAAISAVLMAPSYALHSFCDERLF